MTLRISTQRILIALLPLWIVSCQSQPQQQQAQQAPQVGVIQVQRQDVPLQYTMVGRLAPTRVAQVRARVTGIVMERSYREGSQVEQGDLLFQIDPAPLKAERDEQRAELQQALVQEENNRKRAERVDQLLSRGVASTQEAEDARADARASKAAVARARAALKTAELNLSYTRVEAPIAGRAGRALVTRGALVSQAEATQLTTIQQINPLYIDFTQPLETVTQWRRQKSGGRLQDNPSEQIPVQITLPDGSAYPHTGELDFTDMQVDPQTGSVSLRATISNPDQQLMPGTFVHVHLDAGTLNDVLLIPQQAVMRDREGAYVLSVDADHKVHRVAIETRGSRNGDWIVEAPQLHDGQAIIISGLQSVQPGSTVRTEQAGNAPAGVAVASSASSSE